MGVALTNLDMIIEALDAYDRAIMIDPNYAEAWSNKGTVFIKLKNHP